MNIVFAGVISFNGIPSEGSNPGCETLFIVTESGMKDWHPHQVHLLKL